jgi:transcriptional regulator with XRE-family HTH domain
MHKREETAVPGVIRTRRKAIGLSQQDLAEVAFCSRLFVSELERGKMTFQFDKFLAVLNVLGLDLTITPKEGNPSGGTIIRRFEPINLDETGYEECDWGEQDSYGIDIEQLKYNLALSDDEKYDQHERAVQFALMCKESSNNANVHRHN